MGHLHRSIDFECKFGKVCPKLPKFPCRLQFLHSKLGSPPSGLGKAGKTRLQQSASKMDEKTTLEADLLFEARDGIGRQPQWTGE
jgi:hypothetical protein